MTKEKIVESPVQYQLCVIQISILKRHNHTPSRRWKCPFFHKYLIFAVLSSVAYYATSCWVSFNCEATQYEILSSGIWYLHITYKILLSLGKGDISNTLEELLQCWELRVDTAENLSSPLFILPSPFFFASVLGYQNARQNIRQLIGARMSKIK